MSILYRFFSRKSTAFFLLMATVGVLVFLNKPWLKNKNDSLMGFVSGGDRCDNFDGETVCGTGLNSICGNRGSCCEKYNSTELVTRMGLKVSGDHLCLETRSNKDAIFSCTKESEDCQMYLRQYRPCDGTNIECIPNSECGVSVTSTLLRTNVEEPICLPDSQCFAKICEKQDECKGNCGPTCGADDITCNFNRNSMRWVSNGEFVSESREDDSIPIEVCVYNNTDALKVLAEEALATVYVDRYNEIEAQMYELEEQCGPYLYKACAPCQRLFDEEAEITHKEKELLMGLCTCDDETMEQFCDQLPGDEESGMLFYTALYESVPSGVCSPVPGWMLGFGSGSDGGGIGGQEVPPLVVPSPGEDDGGDEGGNSGDAGSGSGSGGGDTGDEGGSDTGDTSDIGDTGGSTELSSSSSSSFSFSSESIGNMSSDFSSMDLSSSLNLESSQASSQSLVSSSSSGASSVFVSSFDEDEESSFTSSIAFVSSINGTNSETSSETAESFTSSSEVSSEQIVVAVASSVESASSLEEELDSVSYCGNGFIEESETCDDGNNENGDGCSSRCLTEVVSSISSSSVSNSEPLPVCGNGFLDSLELCDDGNTLSGDGCSSQCVIEPNEVLPVFIPSPICGNGRLENFEECDDGNVRNGDGCSSQCEITINPTLVAAAPVCGDGVLGEGEECDDRNKKDGDGCSSVCELEKGLHCGDGVLDAGEACDNGAANANTPDTCRADCSLPRCGDGVLDSAETCDDKNRADGDGCDRYCRKEEPKKTLVAGEVTSVSGQTNPLGQLPTQQYQFPQYPSYQQLPYQLPLAQLQPLIQTQGPIGDTGPAAVAVIGAGAAGGLSWMRRRKK